MENGLVYESKGYKKGVVILAIAAAIICFCVSISDFASINKKSEGIGMMIDSREITIGGGRDAYSKEEKQTMLLLGITFLLLSILMLDVAIGLNKCWIKIYQDHLEGQAFTLSWLNKSIDYLRKEQMQSIQIQGQALIIIAGGQKKTFMCNDPNKALDAVNKILR